MISLKNNSQSFGLIAILLHWFSVLAVLFLFVLGLWMVDLDYYSSYYRLAPHVHKSIGVLFILMVLFRLFWRVVNIQPAALKSHKAWEVKVARGVHALLYFLLLSMFVSGYFITTAQGDALLVFDWFSLPASIQGVANLEDYAGEVHEILAFTLIALVLLHAAAALKHHFFDDDPSLRRMLGMGMSKSCTKKDNEPKPE